MSWLVTPREFSVMWPSLKFRSSHWADMTVEEQFAAALRRYLAQLPPQLLATLLADMTDADARAALSRS